ncbi:MAG: F-box/LRR-repeat protein, partial [Oxalobacteraceae bacterium]
MIQSANALLFNTGGPAIRFRRQLFSRHRIDAVFNLSALRFKVFKRKTHTTKTSIAPSCVIVMRASAPEAQDAIIYASPKALDIQIDDFAIVVEPHNVHRLPAELLIHIFSRLSAPKDLQSCMLVSKDWARNSVGLLWHRPAMGKWESIHSVVQSIRKANKFFAYQDLVKRLNMSTLANAVSDGTLMGLVDCKRIERLTLTNCTKLTDISLLPLIAGNRSLLALDITGLDQVTEKTMMVVADNCLRLQGLNVTGCRKLTDESVMAIAKSCRHLKRLKFNNCVQLTDKAIMTVVQNYTGDSGAAYVNLDPATYISTAPHPMKSGRTDYFIQGMDGKLYVHDARLGLLRRFEEDTGTFTTLVGGGSN